MSNEDHLAGGELKIEGRLVEASNATLYASITHREIVDYAIYKPIAGERPLWDFPDGNLASRERASYLISEWGKWNLIPLTIIRDGPYGRGAVQQWIDVDQEIDLAAFFSTEDLRLRALALLDAVLNNTDRKIGHLLPAKNGHLYACDHGVTLHKDEKLRTVIWQFAGLPLNNEEEEQLLLLKNEISKRRSELVALITEAEISALVNRINSLLSERVFPYPSDDWPSIPWPPF